MQITLDTNVLISATFWKGPSEKIISLVENNVHILVLSKDILKEYEKVLRYSEIVEKDLDMIRSVEKIRSLAIIVNPQA